MQVALQMGVGLLFRRILRTACKVHEAFEAISLVLNLFVSKVLLRIRSIVSSYSP